MDPRDEGHRKFMEFPYVSAPRRDLMVDLVSAVEDRFDSKLLPCTLPPEVQCFQSQTGTAQASLHIRRDVDSSPVAYLVPLNEDLKEDASLPKVPLFRGPNSIGRTTVSFSDKRLSRNHLTLTASPDGSAIVLVEGSNPIVVNSMGQRRKLYFQQKEAIANDDIIELIPGHHLFKYATLSGERNVNSSDAHKPSCNRDTDASVVADKPSRKRHRLLSDDNSAKVQSVQVELKNSRVRDISLDISLVAGSSQTTQSKGEVSVEAIRHFRPADDKLSSTFRLLQVQGLPTWANTSSVSIGDVIQGNIIIAILSNYMVDLDWLLLACPPLAKAPHVLVLHGEGDGSVGHMKRKKPANWILHKPPLPISFGTHHSKAMLLVYPKGVRVIVHTANLIHVDWNNKSQGLWMQDFPWKDKSNFSKGCGFENDLIDYLSALKWPEFTANVSFLGNFSITPSFFRKFDYSSATVRLIASVPGYHTGPNMKRWGHMKLRSVLQECTFDKEFQRSPLIYQFSSLGSLDEKWMAELALSMSAGVTEDKTPLGLGEPLIVWPTVEDVRCSLEGYAAGSCIPSPQKNVEKAFLKKYWAKWKASHTGRCRAMPHIKTFTRYNGQKLAWFLLTSSNLSKAAWGALQKNNSQLMIRSYELGVLFLPSSIKRLGCGFSCTGNRVLPEDKSESTEKPGLQRTSLVTLACQESEKSKSCEVISMPVPYDLPPQPYSADDVPWCWDRRYTQKDVYGQVWPQL